MRKRTLSLIALSLLSTMVCYGQKISGMWNGVMDAGDQTMSFIFKFAQNSNGESWCTLDCPEIDANDEPVKVVYNDADSVNIEIPMLQGSYAGRLADGEIKGKLLYAGVTFDINLKAGDLKVVRLQNPKLPLPYKTEEVTFVNAKDNNSFAGTLTYPMGYAKMVKSKVPVVLLVAGSRKDNRDAEAFRHKPFLVLADYLARNGIASLRYDDRGVGGSQGDFETVTTMTNMEDAAAGLAYIRTLKKFGKVGVVGHSEGGTISLMLAARGKADFIVDMCGFAIRGDSVAIDQIKTKCDLHGMPDSVATQAIADFEKMDSPWFRFAKTFNPADDIKAIKCPVMAIAGTKDYNVNPEHNQAVLKQLLTPNSKNLIKKYEGLNHYLQHCTTGGEEEMVHITETISPEVLKDIVTWINKMK